jgi:hypothetical protein
VQYGTETLRCQIPFILLPLPLSLNKMFFQNNLTTARQRRLSAILCSEFENPNQTLVPFASQYIISGICCLLGSNPSLQNQPIALEFKSKSKNIEFPRFTQLEE